MKEYGNAISIQLPHDEDPGDEVRTVAKRMVDHNYQRTKEMHPELNLPEDYEYIEGFKDPVYETEECGRCQGKGTWGDLEWECEPCKGYGFTMTDRLADPPRWNHTFGWLVRMED